MYDIIKQRIISGGYKLEEMIRIIKRRNTQGDITDAQEDELMAMALAGASAENERPDYLAMIAALDARIRVLEEANKTPDEGEDAAYPAWKEWDGVSDDYQKGAVVTHNGRIWESAYDGQNVWEPGAPGIDERFWMDRGAAA